MLQEMYRDYAEGNETAKPDVTSFNTLLKAWAYSKSPDAPYKAMTIIERMHELHKTGALEVAPNVVSYTTVILSYGLSKQPGAPVGADNVLETMDTLHQQGKLDAPSEITFMTLRRAWMTSREPNKNERIAAIDREIAERFGRDRSAA